MKKNNMSSRTFLALGCLALALTVALCGFNASSLFAPATAEAAGSYDVSYDPSPAVYVAQRNANSVVGVISCTQNWNRSTGAVEETTYAQGSGVVIAAGGYILTNYHVIDGGDSYKVLLSNGEKYEATVRGYDSSLDLAVLKAVDTAADMLVPVAVGSSSNLIVGSTVIAIGNPGGEVLANTVTQGIVSALERNSVSSSNTTRAVAYIQHDAAINSGNSGGGLFNYKGELVGINTLKYAGSSYSSVSFEGLGFAIPIDTAYPIALQLIEKGKVIRPQMGVTVKDYEGPNEPMGNYAPASVCIYGVNEDSPAEKAGLKQYDFIYALNNNRITSFREMTSILDTYKAGDTVSVTVVRYKSVYTSNNTGNNSNYYYFNPFGGFFGNDDMNSSSNSNGTLVVSGGYEYITVDVTLELPEED